MGLVAVNPRVWVVILVTFALAFGFRWLRSGWARLRREVRRRRRQAVKRP